MFGGNVLRNGREKFTLLLSDAEYDGFLPLPHPLLFLATSSSLFSIGHFQIPSETGSGLCQLWTATQHQPWPILANTVWTRANLVPRSHSNACLWTEYVAVYLLVIDTGSLVQKSNTYSAFTLSEVPKFVLANDYLFFSFSCRRTCQISLTRSKCKVLFV